MMNTTQGEGTSKGQLEMTLEAAPTAAAKYRTRRGRGVPAARWWFARMRETVRSTTEWSAGAAAWAAAEQPCLSLTSGPTRRGRRGGGGVGAGAGIALAATAGV